jgi:hypothetical protein
MIFDLTGQAGCDRFVYRPAFPGGRQPDNSLWRKRASRLLSAELKSGFFSPQALGFMGFRPESP